MRTAVELSQTPLYVEAYVVALLRYDIVEEYQEALNHMDRNLDYQSIVEPDRAWFYALKGEVSRKLGRMQDALRWLEIATKLDPDNSALGWMLDQLEAQVDASAKRRQVAHAV